MRAEAGPRPGEIYNQKQQVTGAKPEIGIGYGAHLDQIAEAGREVKSSVPAAFTKAFGQPTNYAIGKPLEMLYVPASDPDAAAVRALAKPVTEVLSVEKKASVEQVEENSFAFLELYGRAGGSPENQLACLAMKLSWDRQSDYRKVAAELLPAIAGEGGDVHYVAYGANKWVAYIRGHRDPEELLKKSIIAPIAAYRNNLEHLADGQEEIQRQRWAELIDDPNGNGMQWVGSINGTYDGYKRGFEQNGKKSFAWSYRFNGETFEGVGLNHKPYTIDFLAEGAKKLDVDGTLKTGELLMDMKDFFNSLAPGEFGYALQLDSGRDVECCREASSAQQANLATREYQTILMIQRGELVPLRREDGTDYTICRNCREEKCTCNEENGVAAE